MTQRNTASEAMVLPPISAPVPMGAHGMGSTALVAAEAREKAQVFMAVEMAERNPRSEDQAIERIMRVCRIPQFAEDAEYQFQRGGKPVRGPTVNLMRAIAQCWGHIRYGCQIVASTAQRRRIIGWAWDLNPGCNVFVEAPDEFAMEIQRKDKETGETHWVEADERDGRELLARRGAICERNAIRKLIPNYVTEMAVAECRKTKHADAATRLKNDRVGTLKALREAFAQFGITVKRIEMRLGHKLEDIGFEELDELKDVWKSIRDGITAPLDEFPMPKSKKDKEKEPEAEEAKTPEASLDDFFGAAKQDAEPAEGEAEAETETTEEDQEP